MRVIGITGGVGAGKSEILRYIQSHYLCEIYLADEVANRLKEPGEACYIRLVELLGEEILDREGRIDSAAMADKIFGDAGLLERVNAIVHPAVRVFLEERRQEAKARKNVELFLVEAALLIEAGYAGWVDELWYVYADREVRAQRLKRTRGYSEEKTARIMERQLSEEAFREACDFVIDNSGSLAASYEQIDKKLEAFTWQEQEQK